MLRYLGLRDFAMGSGGEKNWKQSSDYSLIWLQRAEDIREHELWIKYFDCDQYQKMPGEAR